jgi:PHD/YefM family antitoxin component YafN of YafNO toxin-antitoxin module
VKTIELDGNSQDLTSLINLAKQEPILLLTAEGEEFVIAPADDFEAEVESLRRNQDFQRFLDERAASKRRIPLSEVEAEIDQSLAQLEKSDTPASHLPNPE